MNYKKEIMENDDCDTEIIIGYDNVRKISDDVNCDIKE